MRHRRQRRVTLALTRSFGELERGVSVAKFVNDFATIKRDGKPVFEGKRVRVTVEIIEP